jgi:predicted transcriptional regulator
MKCPECEKLEFVISELTKQLEEEREEVNSKTKAELEKEHGVSSKLTKDKMIDEIIEQLFN